MIGFKEFCLIYQQRTKQKIKTKKKRRIKGIRRKRKTGLQMSEIGLSESDLPLARSNHSDNSIGQPRVHDANENKKSIQVSTTLSLLEAEVNTTSSPKSVPFYFSDLQSPEISLNNVNLAESLHAETTHAQETISASSTSYPLNVYQEQSYNFSTSTSSTRHYSISAMATYPTGKQNGSDSCNANNGNGNGNSNGNGSGSGNNEYGCNCAARDTLQTANSSFSEEKIPPNLPQRFRVEDRFTDYLSKTAVAKWSSDELNFLDPLLINEGYDNSGLKNSGFSPQPYFQFSESNSTPKFQKTRDTRSSTNNNSVSGEERWLRALHNNNLRQPCNQLETFSLNSESEYYVNVISNLLSEYRRFKSPTASTEHGGLLPALSYPDDVDAQTSYDREFIETAEVTFNTAINTTTNTANTTFSNSVASKNGKELRRRALRTNLWRYENSPGTPSPLKCNMDLLVIPSSPIFHYKEASNKKNWKIFNPNNTPADDTPNRSLADLHGKQENTIVGENIGNSFAIEKYETTTKTKKKRKDHFSDAAAEEEAMSYRPVRKYVRKEFAQRPFVYPVTFKFKLRKNAFKSIIKLIKKTPTAHRAGTASTYSFTASQSLTRDVTSLYEIYDNNAKENIPAPFTKEFMDLQYHKFIPLAQLIRLPNFQLPKGQESNYQPDLFTQRSHFPKKPTSGSLGAFRMNPSKDVGEQQYDRYYSRLNIYELSQILELHMYHIDLTKEIEYRVLEIFGNYCDFKLGHQTWIRDTTKVKRRALIEQLYSYSSIFYPEIDEFKLEVIIRRGSYSLMQSRLRRERRIKQTRL